MLASARIQKHASRAVVVGWNRLGFGDACRITTIMSTSDKEKPDAWGILAENSPDSWREHVTLAMTADMAIQAAEMLAARSAKDISVNHEITPARHWPSTKWAFSGRHHGVFPPRDPQNPL